MWDLIKIDVFSMCVFRYGMPRCDMGDTTLESIP